MLDYIVQWLLFPPSNVILIGLIGLLLWPRRIGLALCAGALALLWTLSTPAISFPLVDQLQRQHPPLSAETLGHSDVQAIVVLAAGRQNATPNFGDTVTPMTLARIRYAAHLHRLSDLPTVTTGGSPGRGGGQPGGALMREILSKEFGVAPVFSEESSDNTYENARYTHQLLSQMGIQRIALVTHAVHMPRAVDSFEAMGFEVTPAPTEFAMPSNGIIRWTPALSALQDSALALHEIIGGWWYRLRYEALRG